ncbi:MAG: Hpt domain-containing protein [Propionivibrio sp.]
MNAATEFDVGPLTWVKSEIDLALGRADQALQQYAASLDAGDGDLTQIRFCRTHLHQVQGALTIVGLDGVTQYAEALEAMLLSFEERAIAVDSTGIALANQALATIGHYLDGLINGQPNQPLRLLASYRAIQAVRGLSRVSATDLFFPDLSARPPRREMAAPKMGQDEFHRLLKQERGRFQRGFLSWLRNPQDRSGLCDMLAAVRKIEDTQDSAAARSFWWVATGFLSALAEGAVREEINAKQLCARIDLQIRRLLDGSRSVAERLVRDALYFVATADSNSDAVQTIKDAYRLQATVPGSDADAPAPEETLRRKLREVIASTEEAWNKFCAGTSQVLPLFKEHASGLSELVDQLGQTDYRRLAQAIAAAAKWLAEDAGRHSEMLAMEIATAILLAQNAQENFHRLGGDFAHQVDVTVARIHGCIAGNSPQPGSEIPLLDEMSRQAQEKLLIGQVAKEIQSNLVQIEQVLDGFFRDATKRTELQSLDTSLKQVIGALTMMRQDTAVSALRECTDEIRRFADPGYAPIEEDFEKVADQLSMIGFFIDAMPHGADDFAEFSRRMRALPEDEPKDAEETGSGEVSASVEQDVEQHKVEARALLGALREQPEDSSLREELKNNLTALKNDADLVADISLAEQAKAVLSVLESGVAEAPQLEKAIASLKPQQADLPAPSAETIQLSQASSEEIDAELLGIFLEEASEVLAAIDENTRLLQEQTHNVEYLTTIRRSFHTLKGSGRMVGLKDVGEAAWAVEQTLNLWLRKELEVSTPLLDMIRLAYSLFSDWVSFLETKAGAHPDPSALIALADSMRLSSEESLVVPAISQASAVVAETKSDSALQPTNAVVSPSGVSEEKPSVSGAIEQVVVAEGAEIITVDFSSPAAPLAVAEQDSIEDPFASEPIQFEPPAEVEEGLESRQLTSETLSESILPTSVDAYPEAPLRAQQTVTISPVLYEIFSEEASGHLATLQKELSALERNELLPTPHAMYRAAHTLAGISATVGMDPINRLGLALEHALLRRDHSAQQASTESIGAVGRAIAELGAMLDTVALKRVPDEAGEMVAALDELYPVVASSTSAPQSDAVVPEKVVAPESASAQEAVKPEVAEPAAPTDSIPQLPDEIDEQLLPIFLEEALDLNQSIATQMRAWRAAPASTEPVRTLARLLHTLKGSARMAGAMRLGEITHAIETRVDEASHAGEVTSETIEEIHASLDAVQQIIERLQSGELLAQPQVVAPDPESVPVSPVISAAAVEAAAVASPVERRADRARISEVEAEPDVSVQRSMLRVRSDLVDRLVNEAGELSIARSRIEGEMRSLKESLLDLTENVIRLRRQLREIEIQAESQMQSRTAQADEHHAGFDPLEFDRFTRFQELTRMMAESVNDVATVQQNLLKNLDDANAAIIAQARLNREVQQELMSVRMVPFGSLADRLYRIVRQTSKELNKRVNLEIKGSQVELDRSVLDKMAAPLEHMLRNAVAHGVEDRDTRAAKGKPDIGEISLALKQEGNEIILSFADDGAGLDLERIRARGIEAGLLQADEAVDAEHLANLIFTPGFSTAAEVSQVAGRGVGMDVVKTEVGSLGGRIETLSTPGRGTEFRLYIPLTLAVTKALIVRAGSKRYAIPSVMIEQVLDLKEAALTRIRDAGTAEWMGHHYPFHYLPHLLGDQQALPEQHRQYWTLLLRSGDRRISVQVDELMGNEEIVVKNIGPQLARVVGIDGATVLGDGQVVLILNPVALSSRAPVAEAVSLVPAMPEMSGVGEAATLPTVMVVDDSLTVRKITGRLLAREGYQVLLAKDGVEALEQLLDVVPDVMLVDIEMPRMDGFDLTRNVRADERLKAIPIIMITSRTAEKHRSYAFEIGVNHYLGKPYQEDELLGLVSDYVTKQRHV